MTGTAVWTTPRDYTNGETITDVILNPHVRDNLTYLKDVLGGTALQDVTIAEAQAFKYGSLRVQRHAGTVNHHAEGGTVGLGTIGAGSINTASVSFADAFAATPAVVTSCMDGSDPTNNNAAGYGVNGSGFTIGIRNQGGLASTGVFAAWNAEGVD